MMTFGPRLRGTLAADVAGQAGTLFLSNLTLQATTFLVLSFAGLILPVAEFARLSLVVAITLLSSALFELGLAITLTRYFGRSGDERFFALGFAVRLLLLLPVTLAVLLLWQGGHQEIATGIALGATFNFWHGVRTTDLARQDYRSIRRSNMLFAGLRAGAGLVALYALGDALAIAVALYLVPCVAIALSESARFIVSAVTNEHPSAPGLWRYAGHVYLAHLGFVAVPYLPQLVIDARFDAVEVGTYGLVLTFTAPLTMLIQSVRGVLLPRMTGGEDALEQFLWSRRGMAWLALAALFLVIAGLGAAIVLEVVYGARFPQVGPAFAIFFAGFACMTQVGLYSLTTHTLGIPQLGTLVGMLRLVALAAVLFLLELTFLGTIALVAFVLFATELVQTLALWSRRDA